MKFKILIFLTLNKIIIPTKYCMKISNPEILMLIKKAVKNERMIISLFLISFSKNKFSISFNKKKEFITQNDKNGISFGLIWACPKKYGYKRYRRN